MDRIAQPEVAKPRSGFSATQAVETAQTSMI
jgi:hypothetical protein